MKLLENLTEPELRKLLNKMGLAILDVAKSCDVEKPMFALLLFNDPALGQYVGNCNRSNMIKAFREAADRLERREDVTR